MTPSAQAALGYDIVYVRAPRYGDTTQTKWQEVFHPTDAEPGSDLMLLHPDGSEEVLFAAGNGATMDPAISFDAKWVYFAYQADVRPQSLNTQRGSVSRSGADIYKINVQTRQVTRLTQQTWTPTGSTKWSTDHLTQSAPDTYTLGYGIFNLGPCPLPGGRIMFTSSRDGYLPNKGYTFPNLRLYIMDEDGRNVEPVGHLNIGSALHPTVLKDGRVMFSSFETQGFRDSRLWGLWSIWPDGRRFEPLFSAFVAAGALHFQTQLSDGRAAVVEYYNLNNNGFGTLLAFDPAKPSAGPAFGSPNPNDPSNPDVRRAIWFFNPGHPAHLQPRYKKYPFSPPGLTNLTGFTHGEDESSGVELDGSYAGKVTHPSGAPNNDVLMVWSPGPNNDLNRPVSLPRYDGGIYLLKNGAALTTSRELVLLKNLPNYNEQQPKALVPYSSIYGVAEPVNLPFLPNDGSLHSQLPAGTPFGLIGTSSFYKRNTSPGFSSTAAFGGLDPFNTSQNDANYNWFTQGADAGLYTNADIHAVRILVMEGVAHRSYGPSYPSFRSHQEFERLRILGEIPLRKAAGAPLDPDGNPDTSFLARIPADMPFTFQTLDKDGLVLNMAQTWHQVRPGEVRTDCGGCHAHAQTPTDFARTVAGQSGFSPVDLTKYAQMLSKDAGGNPVVKQLRSRVLDVEFHRDIKPILQRSCAPCHASGGGAPRGLALDDSSIVGGYDNTYNRLAWDQPATHGVPPIIPAKIWRQTNASRYVRMFQSRRSLLAWKVFGRRLDGGRNADHPTESTPGVPATLPAGADPNLADLDFTGTVMPPPNSGVPALTEDEKMTIARWIDLGCPISSDPQSNPSMWFLDDLKPTLTVSSPRAGASSAPLTRISIGAHDAYSGLNPASLSVIANFAANGTAAGTDLASLFTQSGENIWTLTLNPPLSNVPDARLTVRVRDNQGNLSELDRSFSLGSGGPPAPVSVTLSPKAATLGPSQSQQFTANSAVAWSISPQQGSIDAAGKYTAPATIASTQTLRVTATSVADATKSDSAVVTLQPPVPPPPVSVTLSPKVATLGPSQSQQFTANTAVVWSLSPQQGSIDAAGKYTAPATIASTQAVRLTAASAADASKSDTAVITLQPPPPPTSILVTMSPRSATLGQNQTLQFGATVQGAANAAVSWSLSPQVGTIDRAGKYFAPASVAASQTIRVTAASVADSSKVATSDLTLQRSAVAGLRPPVPVSVAPNRTTVSAGGFADFTFAFTDPDTPTDIRQMHFVIQDAARGTNVQLAGSCAGLTYYYSDLRFVKDDGTFEPQPLGLSVGTTNGVNSQCTLDTKNSSRVETVDGIRRFRLRLKFNSAFSGKLLNVFLRAKEPLSAVGAWQEVGTITVR